MQAHVCFNNNLHSHSQYKKTVFKFCMYYALGNNPFVGSVCAHACLGVCVHVCICLSLHVCVCDLWNDIMTFRDDVMYKTLVGITTRYSI